MSTIRFETKNFLTLATEDDQKVLGFEIGYWNHTNKDNEGDNETIIRQLTISPPPVWPTLVDETT